MPCYSSIQTNITNADHLGSALDALGYAVESRGDTIVATRSGQSITFSKGYGGAYSVGRNAQGLTEILRKYSEVGVRQWAKKRNFAVQNFDEVSGQMTLVNRRV